MRTILVSCHDAGGAEVISSWILKRRAGHTFHYLLEGPSIDIFTRKLGKIINNDRLNVLRDLADFDFVLTGTSWASELEKTVVRTSKQQLVPCGAYLDHWMEYRERFALDGTLVLPDELWAGDHHAYQLARETFPQCPVRFEPNLYLQSKVDEIRALSGPSVDGKVRVLYVAEPTSVVAERKHGNPSYFGYTEYDALDNYLDYLTTQSVFASSIRIRLHPSEMSGKYRCVTQKYESLFSIEESTNSEIVVDCAWSDWIVGCQSMVMAIGVLSGKRVFSCVPRSALSTTLPFREIEYLFRGAQ